MAIKKSKAEERFFDELKVWSEIKLRILAKYLSAYQGIRGSRNPKIFFVDGFAGAGRFGDDDGECKDGSPIILAKLAQEAADSGKPYRIRCINVEADPDVYAKLKVCLSGFDPSLVDVRLGTFAQQLPDILAACQGCPTVFFLDPFGVKAITLSELAPLLRRPDTELLLNLNARRLRMLAGFEDSVDAKDRAGKLRLVSEVLGESPDDPDPTWLRTWRKLGNPIAWEKWAAEAYRQLLLNRSRYLEFTVDYPVRESYRSNPKYHLLFATRAWKAVPIMNDLLSKEEDDLFIRTESVTKQGQATFFPSWRASEQDEAQEELLREVFSHGIAHQGCCRQEIMRHFISEKFGQFKQKHYRQALDRLAVDGKAVFAEGQEKDLAPITFMPF